MHLFNKFVLYVLGLTHVLQVYHNLRRVRIDILFDARLLEVLDVVKRILLASHTVLQTLEMQVEGFFNIIVRHRGIELINDPVK